MNNLRAYRVLRKLPIRQLSKISGIAYIVISYIENNLSYPNKETAQILADKLDVEVKDLFSKSFIREE